MYRQIATSALAVVTLSVAAVGFAVPASATQTENFANCEAAFDGQTINVASGEDLLITFDDCPFVDRLDNLYLGDAPRTVAGSVTINGGTFGRTTFGGNWRILGYGEGSLGSPLPGGTYTIYYWIGNAADPVYVYEGSFVVNVASPDPDPVPAASGSGPASVIQQFGKPATGTCDANQPEGLDWAGVPSGGWAESWAEWMNGGAGGAVCSRTLVYRGGALGWAVLP